MREKLLRKLLIRPGPEKFILVDEPIAGAIGSGVDVTKPFGNLIVDIGGGTTDVAVISLGGVVVSASVKMAGDAFDQAIMNYVRKSHSLLSEKIWQRK